MHPRTEGKPEAAPTLGAPVRAQAVRVARARAELSALERPRCGSWQCVPAAPTLSVSLPPGSHSARLRLVAMKPMREQEYRAHFDNVLFRED